MKNTHYVIAIKLAYSNNNITQRLNTREKSCNVFLTSRQLPKSQVLHGPGGDQRLLWIPKYMGKGVHTNMKVSDVHAHGLLAHS